MINYRSYPLQKSLVINNRNFNEIIISSHYEEKHSSYMTDEKILAIAKQLEYKIFLPHRQGKITKRQCEWQSFFWEPFFYQNKAYRLVWYWEAGDSRLWVINCYRRKKYEYEK